MFDDVRRAIARLTPETRRSLRLLPIGTVVMFIGVAFLSYALVTSNTESGKIERLTGASITGLVLLVAGAVVCAVPAVSVKRRKRRKTIGGTEE